MVKAGKDFGWTLTTIFGIIIIGILLFSGIFNVDEPKECQKIEGCLDANIYMMRCPDESGVIWNEMNCSIMNVTILPPENSSHWTNSTGQVYEKDLKGDTNE